MDQKEQVIFKHLRNEKKCMQQAVKNFNITATRSSRGSTVV